MNVLQISMSVIICYTIIIVAALAVMPKYECVVYKSPEQEISRQVKAAKNLME